MWNEAKQARFNTLRAAGRRGVLSEAERAELADLTRQLDALEATYLEPATERLRQEREQLESQNRQLEELLRERQAHLAEVGDVLDQLQTRDQRWRERFAEITGREWTGEGAEAPR